MLLNDRYQILTPLGFEDFVGMTKLRKQIIKIRTKNHFTRVAENHPFEVMGNLVNSSDLKIGDLLDTEFGLEEIVDISYDGIENVYDIHDVSHGIYYGDGVVQHNCFHGSSYTLVDSEIVSKMLKLLPSPDQQPPTIKIGDFDVTVWKKPEKGRVYVIGGDIADGTGNDETVLPIYDITNPSKGIDQVACFGSSKITPPNTAYLIAKLGLLYNDAHVMIEANDMGGTVIEFLRLIYEYDNVVKVGKHRKRGILSNNKVKVDACMLFRTYFDNEFIPFNIRSRLLYIQLEYFIKKVTGSGFTYKATDGNNDDHVLASVWALYFLKQEILDRHLDAEYELIGSEYVPTIVKAPYGSVSSSLEAKNKDKDLDKIYKEMVRRENGGGKTDQLLSGSDDESVPLGFFE
jgi:hypothetical protein